MGDLKLFRIQSSGIAELEGQSMAVEKSLQDLLEKHLEAFLGVRFLASEYSTGKVHGGRIDTLGIDENGCPVIIEYKRALNENVINQGLFYLDWLLDHKAEFTLLIMKKFGAEESEKVEWSTPRLLCIAGDFTKYDEHAILQINRNIELIRYRKYGPDFILLDLVNAGKTEVQGGGGTPPERGKVVYKTVSEYLEQASDDLKDRFEALKAFLLALGDDVQVNTLRFYVAFKRMRNFACVEVAPQLGRLKVYVKVNPDEVTLEEGFTRDVRGVGHFGTGDLEIMLRSADDLERAKPLLAKSYERS